jgi:hypothetical protein
MQNRSIPVECLRRRSLEARCVEAPFSQIDLTEA